MAHDDRDDRGTLVELGPDQCVELLAAEAIGRLACSSDVGAPDVVPVNFVWRDGMVWFRTHEGSVLDHVLGRAVSLQVDRYDWYHHTGWSVLVRGVAEAADGADFDLDDVHPWAPGEQERLVRIIPTRLSGRRIELHQLPDDAGGYL